MTFQTRLTGELTNFREVARRNVTDPTKVDLFGFGELHPDRPGARSTAQLIRLLLTEKPVIVIAEIDQRTVLDRECIARGEIHHVFEYLDLRDKNLHISAWDNRRLLNRAYTGAIAKITQMLDEMHHFLFQIERPFFNTGELLRHVEVMKKQNREDVSWLLHFDFFSFTQQKFELFRSSVITLTWKARTLSMEQRLRKLAVLKKVHRVSDAYFVLIGGACHFKGPHLSQVYKQFDAYSTLILLTEAAHEELFTTKNNFVAAAREGRLLAMDKMSAKGIEAGFIEAAAAGKLEITGKLLERETLFSLRGWNLAFLRASLSGHVEVCRQMLAATQYAHLVCFDLALVFAVKGGCKELVQELLASERSFSPIGMGLALNEAAKGGDVALVRDLVNRGPFSVGSWDRALISAAKQGDLSMVSELLGLGHSFALAALKQAITAAPFAHKKEMHRLCHAGASLVDLQFSGDEELQQAIRLNDLQAVSRLLTPGAPYVFSMAGLDQALFRAQYQSQELFQWIVQAVWSWAFYHSHPEMMLKCAIFLQSAELVSAQLLYLFVYTLSTSEKESFVIEAIRQGSVKVLGALLDDLMVFGLSFDLALKAAVEMRDGRIVFELLRKDRGFSFSTAALDEAFDKASELNYWEIVEEFGRSCSHFKCE